MCSRSMLLILCKAVLIQRTAAQYIYVFRTIVVVLYLAVNALVQAA